MQILVEGKDIGSAALVMYDSQKQCEKCNKAVKYRHYLRDKATPVIVRMTYCRCYIREKVWWGDKVSEEKSKAIAEFRQYFIWIGGKILDKNTLLTHLNNELYQDARKLWSGVQVQQIVKGAEKYPEPLNPESWSMAELIMHYLW